MSDGIRVTVEDLASGTVTSLVPVAEAALTSRSRDSVVRTIARQLERNHNGIARAHIAAEAIVRLAEQEGEGQGVDWPPAAAHIRLADEFSDNQGLGGGERG